MFRTRKEISAYVILADLSGTSKRLRVVRVWFDSASIGQPYQYILRHLIFGICGGKTRFTWRVKSGIKRRPRYP